MIYNKMVGGNMKKNKGFTLIEILAVVTIIGLIFILVIPKITTSLKNKKSDVDTTTTNLVLSATKLYVSDHSSKFEKTDGNVSCMPLRELVDKGYLDGPVKNVTDDKDITNGKSVRITYNKGFKYELVDSGECSILYNPPCDSDYCDSSGNGYTEVAYLESTGTQYIDTGVNAKTGITCDLEAEYRSLTGNNSIVSAFDNNNRFYCAHISNLGKEWTLGYGNYYLASEIPKVNTIYNIRSSLLQNEQKIIVNGSEIISKNIIDNYNLNLNLYAFAMNKNGVAANFSRARLYKLKLYFGDSLVRDYVPVIDSDDVPCLYDKIENRFYYNQGTGEFLWG